MAISQETLIDYIAVPFVTKEEDIKKVRDQLGEAGNSVKILAKIDSLDAVTNFEDIVKSADGTIFVRNEL
jgi:pyruvate kinase